MLQEDPRRSYVAATSQEIVALYESTNQPLVQPTGRSAQPAQAAVVGFQVPGGYEVVVALTLQSQETVLYAGAAPLPEPALAQAVEEALVFAESMGFILDTTGWTGLDEAHRAELVERLPAFRAPPLHKQIATVEREKPADPLAAVARLFAAFALALLATGAPGCAGMSAEQRTKAAELHYDLGTNLLSAGDPQAALKEYLEAEKEDPELPVVHNALGLIYAYSFGQLDTAEQELKKAVELDPDFAEAQNNLGAFYLGRGRFAEAVPLFERAIKNQLYKERVFAETNLGWALYKTGAAEKGIMRLKAALSVAPKYCLGWRQLGTIYAELGRLDEARDAFGRYADACPTTPDAHLQAGKVLVRQTRAAEARAEFQHCAEAKGEKDALVAAECAKLMHDLGAP